MKAQSKYGLIGKSLSHSFSKQFFTEKFTTENINSQYNLYELPEISGIEELLKTPNLVGLNVTVPYKKAVLTYVDEMSNEVREIGAANTLKKLLNGKWKAYNTDIYGFTQSIKPLISPSTKALILGSGGASQAVQFALQKMNVKFLIVSRQPAEHNHLSYNKLNEQYLKEFPLIINTTPLGTFPEVETLPPIPYAGLSGNNILFDLVYNPAETAFLKKGKLAGATLKNGLEMLHLQAQKSWAIWSETF